MDCELSGEKKNAKEGDARWKDRAEKMVGRVRNNIFAKENCPTVEQIKWMSQRPTIEDVQALMAEAPSQDQLSSEERTLSSVLQDVVTKYRELSSRIEDTIKSDNVWKTRSLWVNLLDVGIKSEEVVRLGNHLNVLEEKAQSQKDTEWHPREHGVAFKELKQAYESWEKGNLADEDYLCSLIENHREFFAEFLKDFNKVRKINSHISDETLNDWISKFKHLKLEIDSAETINGILKIRSSLRRIFSLVQRKDPSKNTNLLGRVIEEIIAWNRKKLSQEEYDHLVAEIATIKSLEKHIDTKDFDWTQFETKMEGFQWRQLARLVFEDSLATEETIQNLLKAAPRELKAQKVNEWSNLVSKAKLVEWMEEKKIPDRILRYLDDSALSTKSMEIAKFINDATICATTDETLKAITVFDQAFRMYLSNEIAGVEHLESLVKDMIECKFYQTALFEHFDSLQSKVKAVKQFSLAVEKIRQGLSLEKTPENTTLADIQACDRLSYQEVTDLLDSFASVPKQIAAEVSAQTDSLRFEANLFREFLQSVLPECEMAVKRLADVLAGHQLEDVRSQQNTLLREYRGQFAFRDSHLEEVLAKVGVLIRGCLLLQNGLSVAEPMDEEVDPRKKGPIQTAPYREIVAWEDLLSDVRAACKDLGKQAAIVDEIAEPLDTAKKFMQVVHNISIGQPAANNRHIELADVRELVLERRQGSEKIKLEESLRFLEDILLRVGDIEKLLTEEKVDLGALKEAQTFMQRLGINFGGLLEECQLKIGRAEKFIETFKGLPKDTLEKEFERFTEEYNALNISIADVEETFNLVQECHNLRVEADRLLAAEDIDLAEALDVKTRLSTTKYFKSVSIMANLLVKLFYKMREVYELSDEEQTFVIPYATLCKLIAEAQQISNLKIKEDVKANLKEKIAMVNQIFKDVTAHLQKHVYTQSLKSLQENPPAEIFRNFVNISELIADHLKSMEALEDIQRDTPIPEKPKEELERLVPREVITQEVRDGYVKAWKEPLAANKTFALEPKDVGSQARHLEKEVFNKYQSNPVQYERTCEEIGRVLKEIVHYNAISQNLKSRKYGARHLSEYFHKSSGEIRQLNYSLAKTMGSSSDLHKAEASEMSNKIISKKPTAEEDVRIPEENLESAVTGEYQYYKIFVGDMTVQFTDMFKLDKVQMISCNRAKVISNFSAVPQNAVLSTKYTHAAFNDYMSKILESIPIKMKILPGYLISSGSNERLQKLHQLLIERDVVAGKSYSERFKFFIIPREFLLKEWLEVINIVTMAKEVDLFFLIIYRVPEAGIEYHPENAFVPEPMPIAAGKAYKLVYNGKVKDHILSIELLKDSKNLEKMLPEHIRTKIGQAAPATDPLAPSFAQKNHMDLMKNADEGMSKLIKSYTKSINNLQLQQTHTSSFPYGGGESSNFGILKHEPRDSFKDKDEPSHPKRFTHSKVETSHIEPVIESFSHKKSPSFENDLLGALQNVKPTRHFSRQTTNYSHSHQSVHSFSSKAAEPLTPTTGYSDLPQYAPSHMSYQNEGIQRMLNKRPPSISNSTTILSGLGQGSLGMHSISGASHGDSYATQPTSERKSFLQQAINAIQIPPTAATPVPHMVSGSETKLHHIVSKKNPALGYGTKPPSKPTELRPSLNPSHESGQGHPIDQIYKKKPGNSGSGTFQGAPAPHGHSLMTFDHIKNQYF